MNIRRVDLPETAIIGKAGLCTREKNIAADLWQQANDHFSDVADLGLKDENGQFAGFWGAMSDEGMHYLPWSDGFSRGWYLAGLEVSKEAETPEGWTRWILPERSYLVAEVPEDRYQETFLEVIQKVIPEKGLSLIGAACDHTDPPTGRSEIYFPVKEVGREGPNHPKH